MTYDSLHTHHEGRGIRWFFSSMFLALISLVEAVFAADYEVHDLGAANLVSPSAPKINDTGEVFIADGARGVIWKDGQLRELGTSLLASGGVGFNNSGMVLAMSGQMDPPVPFIWNNGTTTPFSPTPFGTGMSLNNEGYFISGDTMLRRYTNGAVQEVVDVGGFATDLNNLGHVVGSSMPDALGRQSFLYKDGVKTYVGDAATMVTLLNDKDDITGDVIGANGTWRSVLISGDTTTSLNPGAGDEAHHTKALDISNTKQVVGYSLSPDGLTGKALLWENGAAVDLNSKIPAGSGWKLTMATSINENGTIVGQGMKDGVMHAFMLKPTQGAVQTPSLASIALVNAETGQVVPGYESIRAGSVINRSALKLRRFTFAALGANGTKSVVFGVNKRPNYSTDSATPFAVRQEVSTPLELDLGKHTVSATPFSETRASGIKGDTVKVNFEIR